MKITHLSLIGIVTDGWSYQDNLLPKYHKKIGYDVSIITSKYIYNNEGQLIKDDRDNYINENSIPIKRLEIKNNRKFYYKFKKFDGLYSTLEIEKPDILFVHGVQFLDIQTVVRYLKNNPHVRCFVDNHADYSNSAENFLSRNILHGILWKKMAKLISPYVEKFYGVLPARVDFLNIVYGIKKDKIELLLMGADDEMVKQTQSSNQELNNLKKQFNIQENDFLLVTGGKIDTSKKQILLLMEAVKLINNQNLKLIFFGSVEENLKKDLSKLVDNTNIIYAGWIDSKDSYKYFQIADLVVFPGRHSVFWEIACGLGKPMLVKRWEGTTHIDVGGNVQFIEEDSVTDISDKLMLIYNNKTLYNQMRDVAENDAKNMFSYENIAKISVVINNS